MNIQLDEVLEHGSGSHYLNNTVAYAVAFAYWNEVAKLKCLELILVTKAICILQKQAELLLSFGYANAMFNGIQVEVALVAIS